MVKTRLTYIYFQRLLASFSPQLSHFQAQNIDWHELDLENREASIQGELNSNHQTAVRRMTMMFWTLMYRDFVFDFVLSFREESSADDESDVN